MLQNYLYLKPTSCYNMTDTNQRDTEKIMQLRYEIPDTFWSLFRSVNREIYMESLLVINEEYQYSNYFLTKEICVQVLSDMNAQKQVLLQREENETDFDMLETTASRILRWLLKTGWLKKIEDYSTMTTNIVIPDYAAVFIEAFERLTSEELEETELYIQNVYATLFSFQNNSRVNLNMLRTGNDVLDTILTEKSLACKENDIVVSCVADGKGLEFLHPIDLYTIFGNAMDNAIECVKNSPKQEKRQIDVLIHRQHQFLIVQIMNPVEEELEFEDNLPVTTKHDKAYHGYGLRSIKNSVKKYNGVFQVKIKDGCFCLKILFPIKE